jgi:ubiquinone/menaquinone biosynthesis C-methylase UbiE
VGEQSAKAGAPGDRTASSKRVTPASLDEAYDRFPRVETEFQAALDESLNPRGPDLLYELVATLGLEPGVTVLDLGCGEGKHAIKLARDFDFVVNGFDPVRRDIEVANAALTKSANESPQLRGLVSFQIAVAETIPLKDASVDLVWCREALYHFEDLEQSLSQCRRVLRPTGVMLLQHMFATPRLDERESLELWDNLHTVPANVDVAYVESAFGAAGFAIDQVIEHAGEWGEYAYERSGEPGRRLLHTARLLRDPQRYIARFGKVNYDIMLGDCLWHVYRMIGKLSGRVYVLKPSG